MRLKHSWAVESSEAYVGALHLQPSVIFAGTVTEQSALNISDLGAELLCKMSLLLEKSDSSL